MANDTFRCLLTIVVAFMSFSTWAWAGTTPLLESQHPDIPSNELAKMTFTDCLKCHGNPANTISPADSAYLPDRHHLRVDTPIAEYSASPYPEKSPDGKHKCVTCHQLNWTQDFSNPSGGSFQFIPEPSEADFRDCLHCHTLNVNLVGNLSSASYQDNQKQDEISHNDADTYPDSNTVPHINEISEASITIDSDTPLVILGSGFIDPVIANSNAPKGSNYSWARLTGIDGTTIDLYPTYVSSTHMEITLSTSAGIEPGSYNLAVAKQGSYPEPILSSTHVNLTIKPKITIDTIYCDNDIVTIYGSGFNSYLNAEHSNTAIRTGVNNEECVVNTWTENKIVANCYAGIDKQIRIISLFDDITTDVACKTLASSNDEPKWWAIWNWWSSWSWPRR